MVVIQKILGDWVRGKVPLKVYIPRVSICCTVAVQISRTYTVPTACSFETLSTLHFFFRKDNVVSFEKIVVVLWSTIELKYVPSRALITYILA